ncbi:MAG: glycosyltransferase family 1 protein, partial [Anaerolineae bacterium]|nr:glycosyltransferase family 1 protein [Anaerolineae bacterium]
PEERLTLLRDPTRPSPWNLSALAGERVRVVDVPLSPFSPRQQWVIPRILRRLQAGLYHSPYYLMPYRPGVPTVLTVYDVIPLKFPAQSTFQARMLFRWTMGMALHAARLVVAISEATHRDLAQHFSVAPERMRVTPLAADPVFSPRPLAEVDALRRRYGLPESFVLYVGSNKPHKNLARLVEAWAQTTDSGICSTLVIAGPWDPRYPEPRRRAEQLGLENIRWLGPIPEADLPALYSAATLFVFPSLYEGFGLPVLEAMACGLPVVCSHTSSLPEVAGDAALLVDPADIRALAAAIERALADETLRATLQARGLERARSFTWEDTAQRTREVWGAVSDG